MSSSQRPVLFVSMVGSGLINTMLVLAGELSRRRVEDLWFATDEMRRSDVESIDAGTPVEFFSLGEHHPDVLSENWDDETYRKVTQRSRFKARRAIIEKNIDPRQRVPKYRKLEEAVEKIQPALMVIDCMCQYGIELAITKKIPFVLNVPFLPSNVLVSYVPFGKSYAPRTFPVPHSGLPYQQNLVQKLQNRLMQFRTIAMGMSSKMRKQWLEDAEVRKELGIAPEVAGQFARVEKAELALVHTVRELDYPLDIPENVKLVGALLPPLPQAPGNELEDWLSAHESVIYIGLGTNTRLTAGQVGAVLEVVRRLDGRHHVLWKLPKSQQQWLPEDLPANLRVENWVPSQLDVLAHENVKLFVGHAGGNGFSEGIHFGKPQVLRPMWVDTYDQARRGLDFGVSLTLDKPWELHADDLLDKIERVLADDSFRVNAQKYAELFAAAGGTRQAADLILGLPAMARN
ncbi:glycosyltransferase [Amycolatopsis sp. 195334CR]|uniref:glycosyltransferase n=1 Tax=Amycolatopsis sp. 195334CR TaxID=2814588 RepID=UPI001A8EB8B9|nr:glycosyltransferase [Amycolatopsis sp. 195334CR]MBN6040477.1 glycosyltransferase family 1 protein [Amycolatopsis sp. 195334CR]